MFTLATAILSAIAITAVVLLGSAWLLVRGARRLGDRVRTRVGTVFGHGFPIARSPGARAAIGTRHELTRRQVVTAQSWMPGRSRAVAALRRDLHRDVRSAAQAVVVGLEAGRPVQSLSAITARLKSSAVDLDVDLTVIAAEPDATPPPQAAR